MSRTICLTGAGGFLGWHLGEALRDAGWRVRGLRRPGSGRPLPEGVEPVETPLDSQALTRVVEGADVLVHAAAVVRAANDSTYHTANVLGTRAAVDAANATGARLLLVSSQAAAGTGTVDARRHEDDPPEPVTGYGRSKLASEEEVRQRARVPWSIVRPVSIYGPRDRQFLPLFRLAARGFFPLAARPDAAFSLIHVRDAAHGITLAMGDAGTGQTIFLAHPDPVSARALLESLARAFTRPFRPTPIPVSVMRVLASAGDMSWRIGRQPTFDSARFAELCGAGFVCSVERAAERLGFRAELSLDAGIAQTAEWYRAQGWT